MTHSYWGAKFVPSTITYNGQTYSTGGSSTPVNYDTISPIYSPQNGSSTPTASTPRASLIEQFQAVYPYFPKSLIRTYVDNWIEYGDSDLALAAVRADDRYDSIFPGLRRDDGSLRLGSEGEYLAWIEGYKTRLAGFGVPTSILNTNRIVSLIEGNVDPNEFGQRLDYVYTQVVTNLPEIRAAYAQEFGLNPLSLSLSSIFASAIDPELNPVEMEFRIRRAQVTGEADIAGFSIPVAEATRLAEFGLDQQAARSFYAQARSLLPTLGNLVDRHNDPDDTFDLSELTDALIFTDPDQRERISRLFAAEESMFTPSALFQMRQGTLPGLVAD